MANYATHFVLSCGEGFGFSFQFFNRCGNIFHILIGSRSKQSLANVDYIHNVWEASFLPFSCMGVVLVVDSAPSSLGNYVA